jgi:(p)ppGpp synthase/HD superfamily hydrolase
MAEVNTEVLVRAITDAERYHRGQLRKGTEIPYLSHLLGVCSIVLDVGGTETEAVAALLHDAAEDVQLPDYTGADVLAEIAVRYGDEVERIVSECSDALAVPGEPKAPWRQRKEDYIRRLRDADASTMLVSAADKLHNLRSMQEELREAGDEFWDRFSAPRPKRESTLWNYGALYAVYVDPASPADPRRAHITAEMARLLDALGSPVPPPLR